MPYDFYKWLPQYWYQNYPTDWIYDRVLNELLDKKPIITDMSEFTVTFNNITVIWIGNFPHAYGDLYYSSNVGEHGGLPSVSTRLRLQKICNVKKLEMLRKQLIT